MQSEYHAMYNYIPAEKISKISYLRMYKTCDKSYKILHLQLQPLT